MFKLFGSKSAPRASWPVSKIVQAMQSHYDSVRDVREDGPIKIYAIEDRGLNFVVGLVQTAPGSGNAAEIGFIAGFSGFSHNATKIESINRNLHISVLAEEEGDLYLLAGVQLSGAFDQSQFMLLLEAWRRDLIMTLQRLSEDYGASYTSLFPVARAKDAMSFALNKAPQVDGDGTTQSGDPISGLLSRFMGANISFSECPECDGRGKIGLIARSCSDCDGSGFVKKARIG